MKARSILLSHAGVLLAGGFLGILMDWSAHKNANGQKIRYELEAGTGASKLRLDVHHLDTLKLVQEGVTPGGNPTQPKMNFGPNSPCTQGAVTDICDIDIKSNPGTYTFTCSDNLSDSCTDPAIQQKDTSGNRREKLRFGSWVKEDFAHLIDVRHW